MKIKPGQIWIRCFSFVHDSDAIGDTILVTNIEKTEICYVIGCFECICSLKENRFLRCFEYVGEL